MMGPHKRPEWFFLDLDNTLWDFDGNAEEALHVLFERHHLKLKSGFEAHQFVTLYKSINATFWARYEKGEIDKQHLRTERFIETFRQMGIPEDEHPEDIWNEYLTICPVMTRLIPGAMDFLKMVARNAQVGIITNGFEETQKLKIKNSGMQEYIQLLVTSETIGIPKPQIGIFEAAAQKANVELTDCLYIGDNLVADVQGALSACIPVLWFNQEGLEIPVEVQSHHLFKGSFPTLGKVAGYLQEAFGWV